MVELWNVDWMDGGLTGAWVYEWDVKLAFRRIGEES